MPALRGRALDLSRPDVQTVAEGLALWGFEVTQGIGELLGPPRLLRDVNRRDSQVFIAGPSHAFEPPLSRSQKRFQSRLRGESDRFFAEVRALLAHESEAVQRVIASHQETLQRLLDLSHLLPYPDTDAAKNGAAVAMSGLLEALANLDDPTEGTFVLIPDTNALISSPAFEAWSFAGIPVFEILLLPTLLSELDSLKIEHRVPEVRHKANAVIRQIKEYRRRGSLTEGVFVVNGRIGLRSVAVEPRVDDLLPWLDPACGDDRMLAGCVEAMRMHSRSVVALVTGDINLQNKAEFARVPFIEPPDVAMQDGEAQGADR